MSYKQRQPNRGVILLVVLGMLSLFSVLVVSFVVFSSQMADTSYASSEKRLTDLPPEPIFDDAITSLIVGTNDPKSVTFGHSLMEDMIGTDGLGMRVGHRRTGSVPPTTAPMPTGGLGQGLLLRPLDSFGRPQSTLFKFPTNLSPWFFDGTPGPGGPALSTVPANLDTQFDDMLAGRIVTFVEGPLYGVSFRVVRSFGRSNTGGNRETSLAGCLVIDLSEMPTEEVSLDGVQEPLYVIAATAPNRLLYDAGPDGEPGRANINDDGTGGADDDLELGTPGSDDIGYRFVLNGQPFNGLGQNPAGVTGLTRGGSVIDTYANIELQPNARLMGTQAAGGNLSTSAFPSPDEQWDAADLENWWLAWQPSDHRRSQAAFDSSAAVYAGSGAAELNRQLGQHIIPSFHRPAVINYLMNAPIWIDGDITDPNDPAYFERTFAQLTGDTTAPNKDHLRLSALITRLRRATMRPLNFEHLYFNPALSDFNGDGEPYDGAPGFSGSNPTSILNEIIQTDSSVAFNALKTQIQQLAFWLINGPWDVDNDNDGIPDSVWTDFNMAPVQAPDGRWIKPMVAALIEDMDGKVNVNVHGNYNQLLTQFFNTTNPNGYPPVKMGNDQTFFDVLSSLGVFGRGGGVGPAEVDFSHLFDEANGTASAPYFHHQGSQAIPYLPVSSILLTRYGNLMNVRYGGEVYNYAPPTPTAAQSFAFLPGVNQVPANPFPQPSPPNNPRLAEHNPQPLVDLLSRIPFPGRLNWHAAYAPMGQPMDIHGVSRQLLDRHGNRRFTNMGRPTRYPWLNDVVNSPYESGIDVSQGDDRGFTPAELVDLVNGGEFAGRLTQLLGDAANNNEALRRLLTTESRSLDMPEVVGDHSLLHWIASKLTVGANRQVHLDRMLAVELRKGSKLNLNRQISNGSDDNVPANNYTDETFETETNLINSAPPLPNTANNRRVRERAYPQIDNEYPNQANVAARYAASTLIQNDFNGLDTDGDGILDMGSDFDGDGVPDKIANGGELLARHLYCLMFALLADPGSNVLIKNFPYPNNFDNTPAIRNAYAARRIAQWAVNAVDYRDADIKCTRLRYDPNPFDVNGFSLGTAQRTVVWGMEKPELEITETVAVHDKRLKRNLETPQDPADPTKSPPAPQGDGELRVDEDPDDMDTDAPDSDMDQFRIPEPSAYVEIRNVRSPVSGEGDSQPSYPSELYGSTSGDPYNPAPRLNLGLTVGGGNLTSPVYRLAVGQATAGQRARSTRWNFDAERVGRRLVANGGRPDELDYLTAPAVDYTNSGDVVAEVDTWNEATRYAAEVRHSLSSSGEFVTIADDDFDPTNDGGSGHRIRLDRFVWFTKNLVPTNNLNVIANAASGMRLGNVYYNKDDLVNPGDNADPDNAPPLLAPGQYAVIGPREETRFGQTSGAVDPYPYSPVDHRLQFVHQAVGGNDVFRFNMYDFGNTRLTPRSFGETPFDVGSVVPILCQSLYPDEVDAARTDWDGYRSNTPDDEQVDMGFNISAPTSGAEYYTAPTHRIADTNGRYPLIDGYRDYDNADGFHPDVPLDHESSAPMEMHNWNGVGTHQEARTVFLQRLADPTAPWHPIDNPYLTMDFMPIDLTTMNCEHDVRQLIDRNGDGNPVENVDNRTTWDPNTGDFDPLLKFDSRRKIPDVTRDRAITVLLPNVANPGADLNRYDRVLIAKRSSMSATMSILRDPGATGGANAYWPFSMQSHWTNGNETLSPNTSYAQNRNFDGAGAGFRQTFGFVNREYGKPVRSDSPRANSLGVGTPDEVYLTGVPWPNREFQSPLELTNVPAVSRTGLLATFSPGTTLQDQARREVPTNFDHLLGFDSGIANYAATDESSYSFPGRNTTNVDDLTGNRAAFEQIFDYVDIGPVWFDSQRWFEPNQVSFLQDDPMNPMSLRDQMFNRTVETLQPPYNFIGKHRTPGRVNLNTTPDYIRRGAVFLRDNSSSAFHPAIPSSNRLNELLDIGESPDTPTTAGMGRVAYDPKNHPTFSNMNGNGFSSVFSGADLYGNGSVHRALTWGISTAYELDDTPGSPVVMGEFNQYDRTVDTRFGRSFKAFIESRRGYSSSTRGTFWVGSSILGNPMLDWRYPTQFAGVFAPAQAASVPSVQRFMRHESDKGVGVRRRTHDMSLMRPHPDFDLRTMTDGNRNLAQTPANTEFSIRVEDDPTGNINIVAPPEVRDLRMPLVNTGLFERPQAELHQNFRNLDRDAFFRHQNAARLSNVTTHHSNVFMVRLTLGYFVVDPTTGSVSAEYVTDTGSNLRSRATYIVDRSIPIGFLRGLDINALNTVIYSSIEE